MSDEEEREEAMQGRTPLREDVQQLEKSIPFGSGGEGGEKVEGVIIPSFGLTDEGWQLYHQQKEERERRGERWRMVT